jgi:hypothetical protein
MHAEQRRYERDFAKDPMAAVAWREPLRVVDAHEFLGLKYRRAKWFWNRGCRLRAWR